MIIQRNKQTKMRSKYSPHNLPYLSYPPPQSRSNLLREPMHAAPLLW